MPAVHCRRTSTEPVRVPTLLQIHIQHARQAARIKTVEQDPDAHDPPAFDPMVVVVCLSRDGTATERRLVAPTPADLLGGADSDAQDAGRGGLRLLAVTSVLEAWRSAPDADPEERPDWHEVLVVGTLGATGETLTTVRRIVRRESGAAGLGEALAASLRGAEVELAPAVFDAYARHGSGTA